MSTIVTSAPGRRAQGDEQTDHARSDHHDAVGWACPGVPQAIQRGLHVGGEDASSRGNLRRQRRHHRYGRLEAVLVRVQGEHGLAGEIDRPIFHDADRAIAVFNWERERALLHGCAHAVVLSNRDKP